VACLENNLKKNVLSRGKIKKIFRAKTGMLLRVKAEQQSLNTHF